LISLGFFLYQLVQAGLKLQNATNNPPSAMSVEANPFFSPKFTIDIPDALGVLDEDSWLVVLYSGFASSEIRYDNRKPSIELGAWQTGYASNVTDIPSVLTEYIGNISAGLSSRLSNPPVYTLTEPYLGNNDIGTRFSSFTQYSTLEIGFAIIHPQTSGKDFFGFQLMAGLSCGGQQVCSRLQILLRQKDPVACLNPFVFPSDGCDFPRETDLCFTFDETDIYGSQYFRFNGIPCSQGWDSNGMVQELQLYETMLSNDSYSVVYMGFSMYPTQNYRISINHMTTYTVSDFFNSIGGALQIISSIFGIVFPAVLVFKRKLMFTD